MRLRRALPPAAAVVGLVVAIVLVLGQAADRGAEHAPAPAAPAAPRPLGPPPTAAVGVPRLFSPSSVWNAPLGDDAPLDPQSRDLATGLEQEVQREEALRTGPWIATQHCAPRIYTVPGGQREVPVRLDAPTLSWRVTLARALQRVPIPPGARPEQCADAKMIVLQPSRDRYWDFFRLREEADGWHAAWGGAIAHVSRDPGHFTPAAWPGATTDWGTTATSLPLAAGVVRLAEFRRGIIPHALALDLPQARAGVVVKPAQRTDGLSTSPTAIPEGAHLRLDPRLDIAALHLPRAARALAYAAQEYGMIVRDTTHHAIKFDAEDPGPLGVDDPYPALFAGATPLAVASAFPWGHVQVLRMDTR